MSQTDQIQKIILDILGQDNQIRKTSEELLDKFKAEQTDNYVLSMIQLMKDSTDQAVRSFASIALRKNLSDFSEKNFENLYPKISIDTQNQLKQNLFIALQSEQVNSNRHQICDAIGEIGGSLIKSDTANEWPELVNLIFQLLSGSEVNIESGFKILSSIFTYQSEIFNQHRTTLYGLFNQALLSNNKNIQLASVQAFGSLIEVMDPKDCKQFEELIPQILEVTYNILLTDEEIGEDILQVLSDISEAEPKFYKKYFTLIFQTMHKITWEKQIQDKGIKREATELLVALGERIPKLFKDNQNLINQLLEMIFFHMVDIENEITQEWQQPKEGFNEDLEEDSDLETVRFGMNAIDRLISSIGDKVMLPQLSSIVQIMLQHFDWRYRNAAIMALSQVGEYVEDIEQIKPIIQVVLQYCQNENPKIRYAVCHCIGQISDDMQTKFQENFHQDVLPKLCQLMQDPVPRVISHAAAAITNFVEGMSKEDLDLYLRELLIKCFELLQNGISIVKENVVSVIAAAAEAAQENFKPYFNDAAKILFNIMVTYTTKEYKQLRGQLIEAITISAHSVGYELFQPFQDTLIDIMIQIQNSNLEQVDPQKSYLLSGWQRLTMIMKENFKPYLSVVIPSLLKLISNIFTDKSQEQIKKDVSETSTKSEQYNTYDTEEAEIAINMISVIIEEMKESYAEYVEQTSQIIIPLVNYNTNDQIRKAAANCLPSLISSMKSKDLQSACNATKMFLSILINAADSEYTSVTIIDQIQSMKECIDEIGDKFMTLEEINEFSQKILQLLMASDKRKAENEKYKKEDDLEEEEIELINEDNDTEEDLHVSIAELMGTMFKTHQELTLPLVDLLYNQILSKVLDPSQSDKMHKFAIFLIDDMIEFLGIEMIGDKWPALSEALIKYATDKVCYVRQASVYGIGILAEKTTSAFINMSELCLKTLYEALQIPSGTEKYKSYGYCKDNTVAAVGKIIKNHSNNIQNLPEVLQLWLNNLPLKYDKPEALKQHDLLVEIVLNKPDLICGQNGSNMGNIIKIYAEIIDTKLSNPEIKNKIKSSLQILKANQYVQDNWTGITQNLTPVQLQRLESCMQV